MTYGVGGPLMSWNSSPLVGAVIGVGGRRDDVVCGTKVQEDEFATRRSRGDGKTRRHCLSTGEFAHISRIVSHSLNTMRAFLFYVVLQGLLYSVLCYS